MFDPFGLLGSEPAEAVALGIMTEPQVTQQAKEIICKMVKAYAPGHPTRFFQAASSAAAQLRKQLGPYDPSLQEAYSNADAFSRSHPKTAIWVLTYTNTQNCCRAGFHTAFG